MIAVSSPYRPPCWNGVKSLSFGNASKVASELESANTPGAPANTSMSSLFGDDMRNVIGPPPAPRASWLSTTVGPSSFARSREERRSELSGQQCRRRPLGRWSGHLTHQDLRDDLWPPALPRGSCSRRPGRTRDWRSVTRDWHLARSRSWRLRSAPPVPAVERSAARHQLVAH